LEGAERGMSSNEGKSQAKYGMDLRGLVGEGGGESSLKRGARNRLGREKKEEGWSCGGQEPMGRKKCLGVERGKGGLSRL